MPRPDGKGGGGDDGMVLIKGGNGPDNLVLPLDRTIVNTSFDGGKGNDTLDLSGHTDGVTVRLNNRPGSESSASTDDFIGTMWSLKSYADLSDRVGGTIKNIENITGTSGNDRLMIHDSQSNLIDGGAGNDALTVVGGGGDTLIGGSGEDWLLAYHAGNILIGGAGWSDTDRAAGVLPTGDGQTDVFSLTTGAIVDFELRIDQIMIETDSYEAMDAILQAKWTAGTWVDPSTGIAYDAAQLQVADGHVISLVGVDPVDANASITIGFVVGTYGEEPVHGGPGEDILYASNLADTFLIGAGAGDDMIVHFDTSQDVLDFTGEAPLEGDWVDVDVNGQAAIRWTYDSGASSITILGLTTADAGSLMIASEPEPMQTMAASYETDGLLL